MSIGASVRAVSHRVTVKPTFNHQLTFLDPRVEKGGGERIRTVSVGHAVDDEHKCGDHAKRAEVVKLWLSARIVLSGLGGRGNEGREDGEGQTDDGNQKEDPARRKDKEYQVLGALSPSGKESDAPVPARKKQDSANDDSKNCSGSVNKDRGREPL